MRLLTVDDNTHGANNRPMNYRTVGKRVRLRRVELNLTQEALATKAGVSLGTIQALEDAHNRPKPRQTTPARLQKIAKALGKSFDDLMSDRESPEPKDPRWEGLNEEHLEVARGYMRARKRVRERIELLLSGREDTRITKIVTDLQRLSPEQLNAVIEAIAQMFPREDVAADPQRRDLP